MATAIATATNTTKAKTTKTKAKAKPEPKAAVTKLDGMVDVEETIEIWNGMTTHPDKFHAEICVLQIQAVVLGEYAIYDWAADSYYEDQQPPWFEVFKLTVVGDRKLWNRSVSAIRSYSQADDIIQRLRRGESAIDIQVEVDKDYFVRDKNAMGRREIKRLERGGMKLYEDRHAFKA